MKPTDSIPCLVVDAERGHADGVHCSANVIRPTASFFISLRSAHRRRDPSAPRLLGEYKPLLPVPGTLGISRSEIKEEAKPGGHSRREVPSVSGKRTHIIRPPHDSWIAPSAVEQLK